MPRAHDRGGWQTDERIDQGDHPYLDWERRAHGVMRLLMQRKVIRVEELRRAIEDIDPEEYASLGYYERWAYALRTLLTEKGILTREEIDRRVAEMEQGRG